MRVSVIIVTYNSARVIGACLSSLVPDVQSGLVEVIVVDNASADGTPDLVRRDFPWARVVAGNENLGYSKGVNVGIREARTRYLFILNPDTVVKRGRPGEGQERRRDTFRAQHRASVPDDLLQQLFST